MKPTVVSADALFEDHRDTLKWQWVAGLSASERRFDEKAVSEARSGADLVGTSTTSTPTACRCWASARSATWSMPPRKTAAAGWRAWWCWSRPHW
jgi:hypothetical protein